VGWVDAVNTWERDLIRQEAANLVDHAWANGCPALQRGYWPYIEGELMRLDQRVPGVMAEAVAKLKERRARIADKD